MIYKTNDLWEAHRLLSSRLKKLKFEYPVTHVYDPISYASIPLSRYLKIYGQGKKETVLLGMNPGPFGMAQTGIPFGDKEMVSTWLGIEAPVARPIKEHPKRPILGFKCPRHEVSGRRLWGWAKKRFETPERFFERFMVLNYCPLAFMENSGKNFTPDKIPGQERKKLFAACDEALRTYMDILCPQNLIGIGLFAETRAREALHDQTKIRIGRILHPSPANPMANRGWEEYVEKSLNALKIHLPCNISQ